MNARQALIKARDKIANPENWCQGDFSNHVFDENLNLTHHQYCLAGALNAVCRGRAWAKARRCLERVLEQPTLIEWNDAKERTHADVIQALKEAIFLAGA